MKVNRMEKHIINKNHKMFKTCDELCFKAKNMYNYALYTQRQLFIADEPILKYKDLTYKLKHSEPFKDLGSNSSQHVLKMLDKAWKSFFVSVKDYTKNPSKYLGKPKLPKYKKKDGRYVCVLTNMQSQIKDSYLYFAFAPLRPFNNTIRVKFTGKHMQTRIIPKGSTYILEIVYEKEIQEYKEFNNRISGIDLGINNFATLTNNIGVKPIVINGKILKSINQYYNKNKSELQSNLKKRHGKDWSNKLEALQKKRDNKIDYFLHCASKNIVSYCVGLDVSVVVIGLNKEWKQESKMSKVNNQNFINIPYDKFIKQLEYKLQDKGIKLVVTEESYTSGTSFLDNEMPVKENYNKKRRIYRGLFISNNGIKINSDVNGSYQIMKKVFPNVFSNGIEGVDLHPIRVNVI